VHTLIRRGHDQWHWRTTDLSALDEAAEHAAHKRKSRSSRSRLCRPRLLGTCCSVASGGWGEGSPVCSTDRAYADPTARSWRRRRQLDAEVASRLHHAAPFPEADRLDRSQRGAHHINRSKSCESPEEILPTGNKGAGLVVVQFAVEGSSREEPTDQSQTRGNPIRASDQNTKRRHKSD
jgi:hypothetical protein